MSLIEEMDREFLNTCAKVFDPTRHKNFTHPHCDLVIGDKVECGWIKGKIASDPFRTIIEGNSYWSILVEHERIEFQDDGGVRHAFSTTAVNCGFLKKV